MTANFSQGLELLEDKHNMGVILMLYASGPSRKTEIYQSVSSVGTMPKKLQRMVNAGILDARDRGGCTEYDLTDSGRLIASDLFRIREHILRASALKD